MPGGLSKALGKLLPHHTDKKEVEEYHKSGLFGNATLHDLLNDQDTTDPDPFPDLQAVPSERVTQQTYDWPKKQWVKGELTVKIMPTKFAQGGWRTAHFMLVLNADGTQQRCVAKRVKDGVKAPPGSLPYESDVIMQAACQFLADAFNGRQPPKPVAFIDCYIIQRSDASWWCVETYLRGRYIKHNNNYGYVAKHARNTPQAFTHFTYEYTEHKMMVVDMQGVGDQYTDPQMHTADGKGFGAGNMGVAGMEQFLRTHWCNTICTQLGLEYHVPKRFGVAIHSHPKRIGTMGVGASVDTTDSESMRVSDFIGDIQPRKGGVTREDLGLLGLSAQQFLALMTEFNALDSQHSGYINKADLYTFFQKARVSPSRQQETVEFVSFLRRVEDQVGADGLVSFKCLVLCWTDNC